METLQTVFQAQIIQRLGCTLLHFVWQAMAIGLILAIVLALLHKSSAKLRYIVACTALALIVLMPIATLTAVDVSVETIEPTKQATLVLPEANPAGQMAQAELPPRQATAVPKVPLQDTFMEAVEPALPYIVFGWLVGVLALSIWHLGGWRHLQKRRQHMVKQVAPSLTVRLQQLSDMLGVQKAVGILESALVQVPSVVGYFKPVILLPTTALTGLGPEQIEAILAHELAHIKRGDCLVNMLQTVVEILGFFHPAVWWVSYKIRIERENCCDDLAVSLSGDNLGYARALTTMAEIRADRSGLAVAVSGGSLLQRIQRLLGRDSADEGKRSWLPCVIAMMLVLVLLLATALALSEERNGQVDANNEASKNIEDTIESALENSDEVIQAARALFADIRNADYERILSFYRNGKWKRDGWKRLLPSDKYYMTYTDFPSWVRWICNTFKDNPIVSVELGEVFVSDREIPGWDRKEWPAVPYRLVLKDGGTIKGALLFRYMPKGKGSLFRPAEAYWMGMLGLDWHLQEDVIQKPSVQSDIQNGEAIIAAFWELAIAIKNNDIAELKEIAHRHAQAFGISSDEAYDALLLDVGALLHYKGIADIEIHSLEKQYNGVRVFTSTVTDPRGIAGRLSFFCLDEEEPAFEASYFAAQTGKKYRLRPQILTSAYVLSVPATLAQARVGELNSGDKPGMRMLSSEELEGFLTVVRDHPEAEIIAAPKMLTNDSELGEMSTDLNHPDITRFECKSKCVAMPDRKLVRSDIKLEFGWDEGEPSLRSTSEIVTTRTTRSGYATILSSTARKNGRMIMFLFQPNILELSGDSATNASD